MDKVGMLTILRTFRSWSCFRAYTVTVDWPKPAVKVIGNKNCLMLGLILLIMENLSITTGIQRSTEIKVSEP